MKFSSVSDKYFEEVGFVGDETMTNEGEKRPYLIILKLKFNGQNQDFAIPFRSNLSNYIPKEQYFSLPPRHSTKKKKIHGLHYIKMFPVSKKYLIKFNIGENKDYKLLNGIIKKNLKDIIQQAQSYLNEYQSGNIPNYASKINSLYLRLHGIVPAEVEAAPLKRNPSGKIE